jgi:hypothetical protein
VSEKPNPLEYVGLIASYSLAASIVHEFSYFSGMGIGLSHSPLSSVDFLRGWIEWSNTGFYYFLGIGNYFFIRRIEKWQSDEEIVAKTIDPKRFQRLRENPLKLLSYLTVFTLLTFILFGEAVYIPTLFGIFFASIALISWIAHKSPAHSIFFDKKYFLAWSSLVFLGLEGFYLGTKAWDSEQPQKIATTQAGGSQVAVIRTFDQWALVKFNNNHFAWLHHESGRLMTFDAGRQKYSGLFCNISGRFPQVPSKHCDTYKPRPKAPLDSSKFELHE